MTDEERDSLAARIHARREELGMSLTELERASGISKGHLSQLERGEASNPGLETVRKIARGLGLKPSDLSGEEQEEEGTPERLPAGLEAYRDECQTRGTPLSDQELKDLLRIEYRGRRPRTKDGWALLHMIIRQTCR